MRFFSDNAAPVHPKVMQAMADANQIDTAYDGDRWSQALDARFAELFGVDVAILWGRDRDCSQLPCADIIMPAAPGNYLPSRSTYRSR